MQAHSEPGEGTWPAPSAGKEVRLLMFKAGRLDHTVEPLGTRGAGP